MNRSIPGAPGHSAAEHRHIWAKDSVQAPARSRWRKRWGAHCAAEFRVPGQQKPEAAVQGHPAPGQADVGWRCNTRPFLFHAPLCYKHMSASAALEQKIPLAFCQGDKKLLDHLKEGFFINHRYAQLLSLGELGTGCFASQYICSFFRDRTTCFSAVLCNQSFRL